jgi:8-oxo-dGTP diphosphatase
LLALNKGQLDCFHLRVKALIFNSEGQVLLLERQRPAHDWDLPGGRLQKGESLMETLRREIREEIGLDELGAIRPSSMVLTEMRREGIGLILAIFRGAVAAPFELILSVEHVHFDWLPPVEAAQRLEARYPAELVERLAGLT